jgi:predicted ester cyclase
LEVVERGGERFNAHDADGVLQTYAPDAELRGPGGMVFKGHDAIRGFLTGWFQGFPDCKTTASNRYVDGSVVVEEGVFTGTHTGVFPTPMGDVPPTGRSVSGGYVDIFEIRDGQCVSDRLIFDRMELMEQLGLVPEPAGAGAAG